MASLIESPQAAFGAGSKLPASSPFWLSRLVLPFIGIAIGASLGSAAGLTLSLANAPSKTVAAASETTQTSHASQGSPASAQAVTKLAFNGHLSSAHPVVKVHAPTAVQVARNKMPDAVKPAMFKLGGKQWRVAMPIAVSVAQPVQQVSADVPAAASTALDTAQSSLI